MKMGMTIDDVIAELNEHADLLRNAATELCKYQMFKADYENRLKADMVAMLDELKEQLREMHEDFFETEHFEEAYGVSNSIDIIQEKIDK